MTNEEVNKELKNLLGAGKVDKATNVLALHLGNVLGGIIPHNQEPDIAKTILHKLGHIKL